METRDPKAASPQGGRVEVFEQEGDGPETVERVWTLRDGRQVSGCVEVAMGESLVRVSENPFVHRWIVVTPADGTPNIIEVVPPKKAEVV